MFVPFQCVKRLHSSIPWKQMGPLSIGPKPGQPQTPGVSNQLPRSPLCSSGSSYSSPVRLDTQSPPSYPIPISPAPSTRSSSFLRSLWWLQCGLSLYYTLRGLYRGHHNFHRIWTLWNHQCDLGSPGSLEVWRVTDAHNTCVQSMTGEGTHLRISKTLGPRKSPDSCYSVPLCQPPVTSS